MKIRKCLAAVFTMALLLAPFFAFPELAKAEKPKALKYEDHQLESGLMERKMPYRVIFPRKYKKEKAGRFPVIYLLHGLMGHYNNWTDKTKLIEHAYAYNFILVLPEGADGWYSDSATIPNDLYESYIVKDLLPEIEKKFRAIPERRGRMIAGLSMGGYGALKFGIRYPSLFLAAGSFSGALDAPLREKENKNLRPSIASVFGEEGSESRKVNDIFSMVSALPEGQAKTLPFIYFDCGTEDFLFKANRDFSGLLLEKSVKHEFRQLPGEHNWAFWDKSIQEFLSLAARIFADSTAKLAN